MRGRHARGLSSRFERCRGGLHGHDATGNPFIAKLPFETALIDRTQAALDPVVGVSAGGRLRIVDQLAVDRPFVPLFPGSRRGRRRLAHAHSDVDSPVKHRLAQVVDDLVTKGERALLRIGCGGFFAVVVAGQESSCLAAGIA